MDAGNWKMEPRCWEWCWKIEGPQIPGTLCIVTGRLAREALGGPGPNILIDPHRACRHAMRFSWGAVILGLCILLTCMMVVCLMIIYLIANLEPGVSGRNSLPLPALRARCPSGLRAFWCLLGSPWAHFFQHFDRSIFAMVS